MMQSFTINVPAICSGSNSSILPKLAVGAGGIAIAVRSVYVNRETSRPAVRSVYVNRKTRTA